MFRVARNEDGFHVWRDGRNLARNFPGHYSHDQFLFGDTGSASGGDVEVDYVRWDLTGAFAPPPRKND